MKVKDLEEGIFYVCILTGRLVLVIASGLFAKKKGLMGNSYMLDNGERSVSYSTIKLYDGQLQKLEEKPVIINKK